MERQYGQNRTEKTPEGTRRQAGRDGRRAERERLGTAGFIARLALEGVPLREMPPALVEALAGWTGNSAMEELLDARPLRVEEAGFRMPLQTPETEPFQVPPGWSAALAGPVELAGMDGVAFDPAALAV